MLFGLNLHGFARSRVDLDLGVFGGTTDFSANVDGAHNYGGLVGLDMGLTRNGLVLTTSVRHLQTHADANWIHEPRCHTIRSSTNSARGGGSEPPRTASMVIAAAWMEIVEALLDRLSYL